MSVNILDDKDWSKWLRPLLVVLFVSFAGVYLLNFSHATTVPNSGTAPAYQIQSNVQPVAQAASATIKDPAQDINPFTQIPGLQFTNDCLVSPLPSSTPPDTLG